MEDGAEGGDQRLDPGFSIAAQARSTEAVGWPTTDSSARGGTSNPTPELGMSPVSRATTSQRLH